MTGLEGALVFVGALGAGAINVVVGSGMLITFPLVPALGCPPVVANGSNMIGLVPTARRRRREFAAGAPRMTSAVVHRAVVLCLRASVAVGGLVHGPSRTRDSPLLG